MFGLRGQELLIVLLIVLLIFGARKLPDLARSLGASAKEFRKGIEDGTKDETVDDSGSAQMNEDQAEATKSDPSESTDP